MMYRITDPVSAVKGVGGQSAEQFSEKSLRNILDLLLFLPLRYEDRSQFVSLRDLLLGRLPKENPEEVLPETKTSKTKIRKNLVSVRAKLLDYRQYYKGRLLISRAKITDGENEVACLWFNNRFLKNSLKIGQEYIFSGEWKQGSLLQATVERDREELIHTGRLVPVYPQLSDLKQGNLRRIYQEIFQHLLKAEDPLLLAATNTLAQPLKTLNEIFRDLHFPKDADAIVQGRELLATEELFFAIRHAQHLKKVWQNQKQAITISSRGEIFPQLSFSLTGDQKNAITDIVQDLRQNQPMNRLLIGDVGSGKTIVAAAAAQQVLLAGHSVCLLAPTKILAQQHFHNLQNLFPELNFQLVTAQQRYQKTARPCFFIGTHGLLNHLEEIQPAFVIYDEQQRFGVKHRSLENYFSKNQAWPHLLSMTATPIPRTFMLSIFSHLDASYLQEMPKNRQMATTWLIPEKKAPAAWEWLADQLLLVDQQRIKQAIVVCPFIDPSKQQSLENVAAAESRFKELQHFFNEYYQKKGLSKQQQPTFGLLHARLSRKQQEQTIQEVYQQKIQILVSTPMVEVGVDLPNADFMVIEAAERFGLASLHQLRGRVGRAGQESFCLLLPSSTNVEQKETQKIRLQRLQHFCEEKDGLKLAELDLENRGAGNIFGMQQSGFQQLRFASWTNKNLIAQAQQLAQDSSLDENTLPLRSIFQIDPSELPIAAN